MIKIAAKTILRRLCPAGLAPSPASALAKKHDANTLVLALTNSRFIDHPHTFEPSTPHWSGFPEETVKVVYDYDKMGFRVEQFCHIGQWGTHLTPPAHFVKGARTLDKISPDNFLLRLLVLDIHTKVAANADYAISMDDVRAWEKRHGPIPAGSFVALRTDWSKRWPDQKAMEN